ncbi:hypothetical protein [Actinacidiphila acididurans]|uniref:AAA+ ATPase domain-containing protein n=1 Tax=Actinacidiphila acididurans TaxID=2784346 RepID=A0ABS2U206_9ACTN|nr:hypothetical protein [Actinacidiphila acididurans]MBM9509639.1 hypothetical protein [Actinacidiphila acididurans]
MSTPTPPPAAAGAAGGTPGAAPPRPEPPAPQNGPAPGPKPEPDPQPAAGDGGGAQGGEPADPPHDRVGPGDEASAATGRLGQGSQRYDHLRNAFANVDGDVVGGDKYVYLLGGERDRLRPVSPLLVERVRFAYEEAPGADDAREALRRHGIVILRGAAGLGKTATAVRLLIGACRGPVYHLDSGVDFASLADRLDAAESGGGIGIEAGAGFLLDRPADARNLRGEIHDRLQTALITAGAVMVVTVADTDLADSELLSGVVDLTLPPSTRALVRRHLDWRLGAGPAGLLLAEPEVEELVAAHLAARTSCKAAADLAIALEEEYGSGAVDTSRIRDRLARQDLEAFEIWAEGLADPFVRAFALALAVLNGLPQEDVAQAARALLRRMDGALAPAQPDPGEPRYGSVPGRDPFAVPMRRLLARLRARRVPPGAAPRSGAGRPADSRARCLEYEDPQYPRQVLAHAWSQYAGQDVLLDWFGELVRDRSEEVRVYAAVALGGLLPSAFGYLGEGLLADWAFAQDFRLREAAGYALAAGSRDPGLLPDIEAMVGVWFADRGRPMGQATAARVYGLSPLTAGSRQNLALLARLAVVDNVKVAVAIGNSCSDLIAGDYRLALPVLGVLRSRVNDPQARPTSLLAFLVVASALLVDGTRPGMAPGEGWPALLYLTADQPELREPLLVLWRDALSQAHFNKQAQHVLRTWAALAESDDKLRESFLAMVAGIVYGDPRSAAIVRACAQEWVGRDELVPLPLVAWEVRKVLEREKV